MSKSAGHYSGWVKRDAVQGRFTGPIGMNTTGKGFRVVEFAPPKGVREARLADALKDKKK
jgi:hypothetical protein